MTPNGVHAIQTGRVAVKVPFLTREGGPLTSKLRILASTEFTPPLPILSWLIEHEEGDLLIDAGMGAAAADPDYLSTLGPFDAWLSRRLCRFTVAPHEGLGARLAVARKDGAKNLRVVLTHLHSDHIDGLADLSGSDIRISDPEWRHHSGAPKRLLARLQPSPFTLEPDPSSPFGAAFPLTRAGDVFAVPTPGHTPHHCSVILRRGGMTFLFAGDAVYDQRQLLTGTLAGSHADAEKATATIHAIRAFADREPCIFLPSHDPGSARRLSDLEVLRA